MRKEEFSMAMCHAVLALIAAISGLAGCRSEAQQRPNIVLFVVDDLGWADNSLRNAERYHTPNLERLARAGFTFTDAYATPVCTPSRVSLMTGMNAARHRVTNWTSPLRDTPSDAVDSTFAPPDWNVNGLDTAHTPLPQILRDAGYFTIHVGKAHWGTPAANPLNLGFVKNIAGHAAGHPQSYLSEENYGNLPGRNTAQSVPDLQEYYGTGVFLTEALTREALKSLEYPIGRRQPFFLHLAHYAVHVPLMADDRFVQKYREKGLDEAEARYASLVEGVDKSLGDVLDFVENNGLADNTLIVFLSDNGGLALAPPRGGQPFTHNLPLRAGKGSVYEGGIRIPFVMSYPKMGIAASEIASPVIIEDLFPTLLELAGIANAQISQTIDGQSFVPLLREPSHRDASKTLVWHYPHKWTDGVIPGTNYYSAIRRGDWKLVYGMRDQNHELYNLADDLGETDNLKDRHPAKAAELLESLLKRLSGYGADRPRPIAH